MKTLNQAFLELSKEHQAVLIEDKWMLASWAFSYKDKEIEILKEKLETHRDFGSLPN